MSKHSAPEESPEVLKQLRMKKAIAAMEEMKLAKQEYYKRYNEIKEMVQAGAEIQGGKINAKYGTRFVRRPRYKQILIDLKGEAFQKQMLEKTEPHAHFYVRLIAPKPKQ